MEILLLSIVNNKILFFSVIFLIITAIAIVGYKLYKEKKQDQEEIDEIIYNLVDSKRKPIDYEEEEEIEVPREIVSMNHSDLEPDMKKENYQEDYYRKDYDDNIQKDSKSNDIEMLLKKMEHDLKSKKEQEVEKYEREQEENSIISYKELAKSMDKLKSQNERRSDHFESVKEEPRYKGSEFISPVYGKMKNNINDSVPTFNKKSQEKEIVGRYRRNSSNYTTNDDMQKFEDSIYNKRASNEERRNDEFLKALKEFRKNLD